MEVTKEQKVLQQVMHEAWENAEFKKELIANPVAAIERLTGEKLSIPEGKTIVVRDQTDESIVYINIPADQELEDVELNEEQLEAVAGGVDVITPYGDPSGGFLDYLGSGGLGLGSGGPGPIDDLTVGGSLIK